MKAGGKTGVWASALMLLAAGVGGIGDGRGAEPKPDGSVVENPFRGVMQDRTADSPEAALFVEKCGMCHRQMGMGTVLLARRMDRKVAMLEARADLTAPLIRIAVRHGIGNMPRIGRGELSDAQLQRISAYLTGAPSRAVPSPAAPSRGAQP